jgi:hypothetical protein
MKKVLMSVLAMGVMASSAMADWIGGELTYIETANTYVAIKIVDANSDVHWMKFAGTLDSAKVKNLTAVSLTALSTGRAVSVELDSDGKVLRMFIQK